MSNPYERNLDQVAANYQVLSPLTFIERSAAVYPQRTAVVHGDLRRSWAETYARCRQLASVLAGHGVGLGDTVAVMGANTPELYECHFGVPMTGGVLNALNIRLDAEAIAFILDHGEARVLITDSEFSHTIKAALELCDVEPLVIDIDDALREPDFGGELLGEMDYEAFIAPGDPEFDWSLPDDEWRAISLNYTSGTTGNPKGVVYHHRGAYLNAMGNVVCWSMAQHPTYLWTLPMFHCNGWCFPWTLAALAGTSICLRKVTAGGIFSAIERDRVDHFCGAPVVLNFIINATDEERRTFDHEVKVMTAAAPPPPAVLERMAAEGFAVTHVYGLTETYGPAVVCAWQDDWDDLGPAEQASLKSRQGVRYHVLHGLSVRDPETMAAVPPDGETMGEVMFQGNIVMKGYFKNPQATEEALSGDWFHSGDLGVLQPDGYIQLRDRSKDIIISGGENISSIEVESVLYRHAAVLEAAVVAKADEKWGETPCAFVELKPDAGPVEAQEIIDFCRQNLAHYKCPRYVVFGPLPKTSTGKVKKFELRDQTATV
ncbi:MAG TPA: acyl-CoA synthetase [Alphaproteobacteria bacterium]|jgi:fatty-acyl-CoA synthase|nr:acyl-CoA synthetase [Alphaproteobacteria bacterium]MDP6270580.1 acyl-CoA synthetase [Alphaproteobacteria bacterium]MDP7164970.1 acyl-CoA synthetase [Alphaproteobacteria bacterium]HJM49643.1 acyl-CoA synthetase [Alphaproteobacteria bacterium]